jgi:uncharacterized protein
VGAGPPHHLAGLTYDDVRCAVHGATNMTANSVNDLLSLLDWRRTIGDLYAEIRAASNKRISWGRWQETRARLFREHPQSPIPSSQQDSYRGPYIYEYDPAWRLRGTIETVAPAERELRTSRNGVMGFRRFGVARFTYRGAEQRLELYWLESYGGGLFLPFADLTTGAETYGAGRYLLDTAKGADLGQEDGLLVLDFNFAYQPSCAYDPRWTCPLTPPANRLAIPVRAGERLASG